LVDRIKVLPETLWRDHHARFFQPVARVVCWQDAVIHQYQQPG